MAWNEGENTSHTVLQTLVDLAAQEIHYWNQQEALSEEKTKEILTRWRENCFPLKIVRRNKR